MVKFHRINESVHAVERNYNQLLGPSWVRLLSDSLLNSDYMDSLQCYISEAYKSTDTIYPVIQNDIFRPFRNTKATDIKVVLFDDEPVNSVLVNGLAFGCYKQEVFNYGTLIEKTKDLKRCLDPNFIRNFQDFDTTLLDWADQKVLLLNTCLISERGAYLKHEHMFRNFTREIIKQLSNTAMEIVFVFTSKRQAELFEKYIDTDFHTVLHYDGIDIHSSMFEDINDVLKENRGESNMIKWW